MLMAARSPSPALEDPVSPVASAPAFEPGQTGIPRSPKWDWLASAFWIWVGDLCRAYGFRMDCWYDRDGIRTVELLGPDSPGEYVITFPVGRLEERHLQALLRDVVIWVDSAGLAYTGQYAGDLVPEAYRTGRSQPWPT